MATVKTIFKYEEVTVTSVELKQNQYSRQNSIVQ